MADLDVTPEMIAREFRLQHCRGSIVDAISDPLVYRALEMGARHRIKTRGAAPKPSSRDGKSRAANDND